MYSFRSCQLFTTVCSTCTLTRVDKLPFTKKYILRLYENGRHIRATSSRLTHERPTSVASQGHDHNKYHVLIDAIKIYTHAHTNTCNFKRLGLSILVARNTQPPTLEIQDHFSLHTTRTRTCVFTCISIQSTCAHRVPTCYARKTLFQNPSVRDQSCKPITVLRSFSRGMGSPHVHVGNRHPHRTFAWYASLEKTIHAQVGRLEQAQSMERRRKGQASAFIPLNASNQYQKLAVRPRNTSIQLQTHFLPLNEQRST